MYDILCAPLTIVTSKATAGGDTFAGTPNTMVKVWLLDYDP
jgi:hypothetical protein